MLTSKYPTEDKLILLYILKVLNTGISKDQLASIVVDNLQINYFDIMLYTEDLINEDLIRRYDMEDGQKKIALSGKGNKVLEGYESTIPTYIKELVNTYLSYNKDKIFKDVRVTSFYTKEKNGEFCVHLKLHENNSQLIALDLYSPTLQLAEKTCEKWQKDNAVIYDNIIKLFYN